MSHTVFIKGVMPNIEGQEGTQQTGKKNEAVREAQMENKKQKSSLFACERKAGNKRERALERKGVKKLLAHLQLLLKLRCWPPTLAQTGLNSCSSRGQQEAFQLRACHPLLSKLKYNLCPDSTKV